MITAQLRVQLADFGLAQFVDSATASFGSVRGAVRWSAPEVIVTGGRLTFASDVYAFGCVCLEVRCSFHIFLFPTISICGHIQLYTQNHPFPDCFKDAQVIACILRGQRPEKPQISDHSTYDRELWNLVERCWEEDPIHRPTAGFLADSLPTKKEPDLVEYDIDLKPEDAELSTPEMVLSELACTGSPPSLYSESSRDRPCSPTFMLSEQSITNGTREQLSYDSKTSSDPSSAYLHPSGSGLSSLNYDGRDGLVLPSETASSCSMSMSSIVHKCLVYLESKPLPDIRWAFCGTQEMFIAHVFLLIHSKPSLPTHRSRFVSFMCTIPV